MGYAKGVLCRQLSATPTEPNKKMSTYKTMTSAEKSQAAYDYTERVKASMERLDGMTAATASKWIREAKKIGIAYDAASGLGVNLPDGSKRIIEGSDSTEKLNTLIRALG